jgi:hypothetical protein
MGQQPEGDTVFLQRIASMERHEKGLEAKREKFMLGQQEVGLDSPRSESGAELQRSQVYRPCQRLDG